MGIQGHSISVRQASDQWLNPLLNTRGGSPLHLRGESVLESLLLGCPVIAAIVKSGFELDE